MFDPRVPYDLWLDCFNSVPDNERPSFRFRRLNGTEFNALGRAYYDTPSTDTEALSTNLLQALSIGLVGWHNQIDPATEEAVAFDLKDLPRIVNAQEAVELIEKRIARGRVNGTDLKNSASQS